MFIKQACFRNDYAVLYYCGSTELQGNMWEVFLIASPDNIIYDIGIFPKKAVRFYKKRLVIQGEQKEVFYKV